MKPNREQARDLVHKIRECIETRKVAMSCFDDTIPTAHTALQSAYAAGLADGKPKWLPMDDAPRDKDIFTKGIFTPNNGEPSINFTHYYDNIEEHRTYPFTSKDFLACTTHVRGTYTRTHYMLPPEGDAP